MNTRPAVQPGTVHLVGGGPGDPGLLTVRAVERLRRADVVLYDYLVNPAELEHAAPGAELVALGCPHTGRRFTPEEITDLMVEAASRGKDVVRLKGGDPSVFGRCADESDALREAGIPFEIVPGITAGLAAAAYCELPVTQHSDASAVALVTGRERDAKHASSLDYPALAAFPGTLIFYMGVGRAPVWSTELMRSGKAPDTPVAIVQWCTRSGQRCVQCRLDDVVETIEREALRPPAVIVVGDVAARAPDRSWFSARPLFGRQVLVPEPTASTVELRERLTALGAGVLPDPALRVVDPASWEAADRAVDALASYDWIVFSRPEGVDRLLHRLVERGGDVRRLGGAGLAALGPGTRSALAAHDLRADVVGAELSTRRLRADAGTEFLLGRAPDDRFLFVGDGREDRLLARALERRGARADEAPVYSVRDADQPALHVADGLAAGDVTWIVVARGRTVRALHHLYGTALRHARIASLRPYASESLRELGYEPSVEVFSAAVPLLADAMLDAEGAAWRPSTAERKARATVSASSSPST